MTQTDRADNLKERVVGQRYYDKQNDESFTVVDVHLHEGTPTLVLLQYDDGVEWDEMPTPDMIKPEDAERFGVEEGGIDSERYIQLGPGPSVKQSKELCPRDGHKWAPTPDEIWPDGLPHSGSNARLSKLYHGLVRCKRCGLSGNAALEFASSVELPWFCERCGDVEEDGLFYRVEDWEDQPICSDCNQDLSA